MLILDSSLRGRRLKQPYVIAISRHCEQSEAISPRKISEGRAMPTRAPLTIAARRSSQPPKSTCRSPLVALIYSEMCVFERWS